MFLKNILFLTFFCFCSLIGAEKPTLLLVGNLTDHFSLPEETRKISGDQIFDARSGSGISGEYDYIVMLCSNEWATSRQIGKNPPYSLLKHLKKGGKGFFLVPMGQLGTTSPARLDKFKKPKEMYNQELTKNGMRVISSRFQKRRLFFHTPEDFKTWIVKNVLPETTIPVSVYENYALDYFDYAADGKGAEYKGHCVFADAQLNITFEKP